MSSRPSPLSRKRPGPDSFMAAGEDEPTGEPHSDLPLRRAEGDQDSETLVEED